MIKYVCIEAHPSGFLVGSIYIINIFLSKEEAFEDFIEIYDINNKPIGEWWIDLDKYFIPLAEWRDKQIESIIND